MHGKIVYDNNTNHMLKTELSTFCTNLCYPSLSESKYHMKLTHVYNAVASTVVTRLWCV